MADENQRIRIEAEARVNADEVREAGEALRDLGEQGQSAFDRMAAALEKFSRLWQDLLNFNAGRNTNLANQQAALIQEIMPVSRRPAAAGEGLEEYIRRIEQFLGVKSGTDLLNERLRGRLPRFLERAESHLFDYEEAGENLSLRRARAALRRFDRARERLGEVPEELLGQRQRIEEEVPRAEQMAREARRQRREEQEQARLVNQALSAVRGTQGYLEDVAAFRAEGVEVSEGTLRGLRRQFSRARRLMDQLDPAALPEDLREQVERARAGVGTLGQEIARVLGDHEQRRRQRQEADERLGPVEREGRGLGTVVDRLDMLFRRATDPRVREELGEEAQLRSAQQAREQLLQLELALERFGERVQEVTRDVDLMEGDERVRGLVETQQTLQERLRGFRERQGELPQEQDEQQPGFFDRAIQMLGGFGGRLGGLLGKLGPAGAFGAAAVGAYTLETWLVSWLLDKTKAAREEEILFGTLGQRTGSGQRLLDLFRDPATRLTEAGLVQRGFTATDAGNFLEATNRGIRPGQEGAARATALSGLYTAFATGLDYRQLGSLFGDVTRFSQGMGLEQGSRFFGLLRGAVEEGFTRGISSQESIAAYSKAFASAAQLGGGVYGTGVSGVFRILEAFGDTGRRAFMGERGADVVGRIAQDLTNEDPGRRFFLMRNLANVDATKVFAGDPEMLAAYNRLDPYARADLLLSLAGQSPEVMQAVMGSMGGMGTNLQYYAMKALFPSLAPAERLQLGMDSGEIVDNLGRPARTVRPDAEGTQTREGNKRFHTAVNIEGANADLRISASHAYFTLTGDLILAERNVRLGLVGGANSLMGGFTADLGGTPADVQMRNDRQVEVGGGRVPTDPDQAARLAASLFAGGLEGSSGNSTNRRTGAFGYTQILPGNLRGAAGWDRAFAQTLEGSMMLTELRVAGVTTDPRDPIPDAATGDLKGWYEGLNPNQRQVVDRFLRGVSQFKLEEYFSNAMAKGASPEEAYRRTLAAWYGGPRWLEPGMKLDASNPEFTRLRGEAQRADVNANGVLEPNEARMLQFDANRNGRIDVEPSVQQYIERHLEQLRRLRPAGETGNVAGNVTVVNNITINGSLGADDVEKVRRAAEEGGKAAAARIQAALPQPNPQAR